MIFLRIHKPHIYICTYRHQHIKTNNKCRTTIPVEKFLPQQVNKGGKSQEVNISFYVFGNELFGGHNGVGNCMF